MIIILGSTRITQPQLIWKVICKRKMLNIAIWNNTKVLHFGHEFQLTEGALLMSWYNAVLLNHRSSFVHLGIAERHGGARVHFIDLPPPPPPPPRLTVTWTKKGLSNSAVSTSVHVQYVLSHPLNATVFSDYSSYGGDNMNCMIANVFLRWGVYSINNYLGPRYTRSTVTTNFQKTNLTCTKLPHFDQERTTASYTSMSYNNGGEILNLAFDKNNWHTGHPRDQTAQYKHA